ncbi:MAG: (Fe-S)-binding protein, partial [Candidatus Bathyarchaeia archaeon]
GQGLINIAQELLEGKLTYEDGLIQLIYSCTTCGACDINCKSIRDMEVLDTILALRAKCVEDGWGPMPKHKDYARLVGESHNIYGKPHGNRLQWIPKDIQLSEDSDIAYFTGCTTAYLFPDIALNTIKILKAADIDFKVLTDEYCCGALLWRTGQREVAKKLAEHNLEVLRVQGIRTLITSCAYCYGTFKGFYPRIAKVDFKVLHISEVVQKMLKEGKLKFNKSIKMKVTYHDPCLLGRLSEEYIPWTGKIKAFGYHDPPKKWRRGTYGVYDAPREVLRAIPDIQLIEMPRNEENSFCCGGGGGVPDAFPDLALWIARERLDEAKSTGAEAIVSCCPFCKLNLERSIKILNEEIRYYDLTDLIIRAL